MCHHPGAVHYFTGLHMSLIIHCTSHFSDSNMDKDVLPNHLLAATPSCIVACLQKTIQNVAICSSQKWVPHQLLFQWTGNNLLTENICTKLFCLHLPLSENLVHSYSEMRFKSEFFGRILVWEGENKNCLGDKIWKEANFWNCLS